MKNADGDEIGEEAAINALQSALEIVQLRHRRLRENHEVLKYMLFFLLKEEGYSSDSIEQLVQIAIQAAEEHRKHESAS